VDLGFDTILLFHQFSAATILLPLFFVIYRRNHLSLELGLLAIYIVIKAVLEVTMIILADKGINNLFLIHVHTAVQYVLLAMIFVKTFTHPILKKGIKLSIFSFLIFALLDAFYLEGTLHFNSLPGGVEALLLITLALMFFYKVFRESSIENLERHPIFLISVGIFLFFSGNLFFFILTNSILAASNEMLHEVYSIHSVLNILLNVFFALGLWFSREKQIYR